MVQKTCIKEVDQSNLIEATITRKPSKLGNILNAWLVPVHVRMFNLSNSIGLQISNSEVLLEYVPKLGVAIDPICITSQVLEIQFKPYQSSTL